MKILSLFDGYSTAQQALKELGIPIEVYYSSEIDPYAISVTQSNFPSTVQLGSVVGLSVGRYQTLNVVIRCVVMLLITKL